MISITISLIKMCGHMIKSLILVVLVLDRALDTQKELKFDFQPKCASGVLLSVNP